MSPKNLFIFGAGASKADNAPLNDELIKEIFSILKLGNFKMIKINIPPLKKYWDYCNLL